jgi:hypothetical protein
MVIHDESRYGRPGFGGMSWWVHVGKGFLAAVWDVSGRDPSSAERACSVVVTGEPEVFARLTVSDEGADVRGIRQWAAWHVANLPLLQVDVVLLCDQLVSHARTIVVAFAKYGCCALNRIVCGWRWTTVLPRRLPGPFCRNGRRRACNCC